MILRILIMMLTMTVSLTAAQETKNSVDNLKAISKKACINACNNCRRTPSEAELFLQVQSVLNGDILLSPLLQTQLIQQLQLIVNEGGIGVVGPQGPVGPTGPQGPAGTGGILDFADFYALMPPDNAATVGVGTDVDFPQDGPASGSGLIARLGPDSFNLAEIGVYEVLFQVSVTEAGQLILTLNGADLAYTVVGRATGTSQIVGMAIVRTTTINSILTVRNPAGNSTALTITPLAGGTRSVSAHLVITRIQ
jgi:hypothetical protein